MDRTHIYIVSRRRSIACLARIYQIIECLQAILKLVEVGQVDEQLETTIIAPSKFFDGPDCEDQYWADESTCRFDPDAISIPQANDIEEEYDKERAKCTQVTQ